jgi:hypothetical protein
MGLELRVIARRAGHRPAPTNQQQNQRLEKVKEALPADAAGMNDAARIGRKAFD